MKVSTYISTFSFWVSGKEETAFLSVSPLFVTFVEKVSLSFFSLRRCKKEARDQKREKRRRKRSYNLFLPLSKNGRGDDCYLYLL